MDIYTTLGPLILGSRLRRLSEYFIAEVNKVYDQHGVPFDASWFPVFYLLSENEPISLRELSNALQVSHSAVSQLVSGLKRRRLVESTASGDDGRRQLVRLSAEGTELLCRIKPIWTAISAAFMQMQNHDENMTLFSGIGAMEQRFQEQPLSARISQMIPTDPDDLPTSLSVIATE